MGSTLGADVAFLAIVAFIVAAAVGAHARAAPASGPALVRGSLIAAAWLALTGLPALAGVVAPDGPVPPQLLIGVILVVAVAFAVTAPGARIAATAPLWALVGFQAFRIPLELVLHRWVGAGLAPPQMTWTGHNFDIITGVVALVAAPLVRRYPRVAWLPTIVGLALLANIARIVVTSLPGPLQRFPEVLTLPAQFPRVWIGSVCVAAALAAHLIAIRALRRAYVRAGS
jgi:hypothetical protein